MDLHRAVETHRGSPTQLTTEVLEVLRAKWTRTLLLLEGAQWKAQESVLHVDGANITSDHSLHTYMVCEALENVLFFATSDAADAVSKQFRIQTSLPRPS